MKSYFASLTHSLKEMGSTYNSTSLYAARRMDWVDISKGITIILMVVGHTRIPTFLTAWIYSFHMPFFFFISGMLTNWNTDFRSFAKKKSVSLLIPFFIYSAVNLLLYPIYGNESLTAYARLIMYHGWGGIALWFIPILWISLLLCKGTKDSNLPILLFAMIGFLLSFKKIILPWAASTIPIACVYILLGIYAKNFVYILLGNRKGLFFFPIMGLSVTFLVSHYWRVDLASNQILPFFPLVMGSLFGIIGVLCFSKLIEIYAPSYIQVALISTGRNTLEILALSQCIILILNVFIPHLLGERYLILIFLIIVTVKIKNAINYWMKLAVSSIGRSILKR